MKLGVIGLGIVGNAFYEGMRHAYDVVRYDKYNKERSDVPTIEALCAATDGPIFVCIPTPMNKDGSCNTNGILSVLIDINIGVGYNQRTVVIKSTLVPNTMESFEDAHCLDVIYNPEFLTEDNAVEDFKKQEFIILGGPAHATQEVAKIYSTVFPNATLVQCKATEAEVVKYLINCFLATKIAFANEMYQVCAQLEVDYDAVIRLANMDRRLGKSHWKVPGPDGKYGFGKTCLPKDLNGMIRLAQALGVDPKVMRAVWEKNLEVRPERDWETMKGRAVL